MTRYHEAPEVRLLPRDLDTILLCTHELLLPDFPTMHTRMLLVAWELELEGVSEQAAQLLMFALQVCEFEGIHTVELLVKDTPNKSHYFKGHFSMYQLNTFFLPPKLVED